MQNIIEHVRFFLSQNDLAGIFHTLTDKAFWLKAWQFPNHEIILVLAGIFVLAYLINYFLLHSFLGKSYRLFVAPGVIMHELSHLLACLVTGAKVKEVVLFDREGGGHVEHEKPLLPLIGQILISIAPFLIGVTLIFLISNFVGLKSGDITLVRSINGFFHYFQAAALQINFASWKTLLALYLMLSLAVTMMPSKQDFQNMFLLILVVVGLFIALSFVPIHLSLTFIPIAKIILILSTVFLLLILGLVFSIIIFALSKLLKPRA